MRTGRRTGFGLGGDDIRAAMVIWAFGYLLVDLFAWLQGRTVPGIQIATSIPLFVLGVAITLALDRLRRGVTLKDGVTRPAEVEAIDPPQLWPRVPPIRYRASIPDRWVRLTIREGRNRQVRRMTAAVGHGTLRLVRWRIGDWSLDGIAPGEWRRV